MEMYIGNLVEGEYSENGDEFSLKQFKHLTTETILSTHQLEQLQTYLQNQLSRHEKCVITLNDQIPLWLTLHEIEDLLKDLETIYRRLN